MKSYINCITTALDGAVVINLLKIKDSNKMIEFLHRDMKICAEIINIDDETYYQMFPEERLRYGGMRTNALQRMSHVQ